MFFLFGVTMPDMLFFQYYEKTSNLLFMTHAVDLMQGTFTGDNLSRHGKELLILGSPAMICTAMGAVLYRKKDWT